MRDFLGNEYEPGDLIVYPQRYGNHGANMVLARVIKFNDSGTVTVVPQRGSRCAPTYWNKPGTAVHLNIKANIVRVGVGPTHPMRLYRTTRFDAAGRKVWTRFCSSPRQYAGTVGAMQGGWINGGTAMLERADNLDGGKFVPKSAVTSTCA